MTHKAGFVNIIGYPNAGKSTLMNELTGETLSIITFKPQTTRHRIIGIVNNENYQIVFSDTPGIVKPHYKLHQSMMKFVQSALQDADIFIYLLEINDNLIDEEIIEKIKKTNKPLLLLINKIDTAEPNVVIDVCNHWQSLHPEAIVIPVSAKMQVNIDLVLQKVLELLPTHPAFYPKDDELSDRPIRFFVSEMIREKIFLLFRDEVPYSTEVVIEKYQEKPDITVISATIYVERDSQKGIILGHKGSAIKKLGTESRKSIESFIGNKVFLDLSVKVSENWRENEQQLNRFGYEI